MRILIDIPEEIYESQRYAQYFGAWSVVLQKHFENGTPIPDNATNGDMFRVFFPNGIEMQDLKNTTERWWNAPYQKGGKE